MWLSWVRLCYRAVDEWLTVKESKIKFVEFDESIRYSKLKHEWLLQPIQIRIKDIVLQTMKVAQQNIQGGGFAYENDMYRFIKSLYHPCLSMHTFTLESSSIFIDEEEEGPNSPFHFLHKRVLRKRWCIWRAYRIWKMHPTILRIVVRSAPLVYPFQCVEVLLLHL